MAGIARKDQIRCLLKQEVICRPVGVCYCRLIDIHDMGIVLEYRITEEIKVIQMARYTCFL